MTVRADIARRALAAALRVRQQAGIGIASPLCPFDLAEQLGVEVWFTGITSLEGMYVEAQPPLVLVGADRPAGRQAFTCAHELGHRWFRHGTRIDQLVARDNLTGRLDADEFAADAFGGFLLMPKTTVVRGFAVRGWRPDRCAPEQAYVVAGWLGVSYEALITHLTWSLRLLARTDAERLLRARLADIRSKIAGQDTGGYLVVADRQWSGRTVDVCVGDHILVPGGSLMSEGVVVHAGECAGGRLLQATRPGIGRVIAPDARWSSFVRVMRGGFVGRGTYRHLEDPDCD